MPSTKQNNRNALNNVKKCKKNVKDAKGNIKNKKRFVKQNTSKNKRHGNSNKSKRLRSTHISPILSYVSSLFISVQRLTGKIKKITKKSKLKPQV